MTRDDTRDFLLMGLIAWARIEDFEHHVHLSSADRPRSAMSAEYNCPPVCPQCHRCHRGPCQPDSRAHCAVSTGSAPSFKLLNSGDEIEATDQQLNDDCQTWVCVDRWVRGSRFDANFHVPMRRPLPLPNCLAHPRRGWKPEFKLERYPPLDGASCSAYCSGFS